MRPPPKTPPPEPPPWPIPRFLFRVEDLAHSGATRFFESVPNPLDALRDAVIASFTWLYTRESAPSNVETIELILRTMDGIAYATGSHHTKEIHFSLSYIASCTPDRAREEIRGVLTHEVVHCYQRNGKEKCPAGLIEGIADYVRLHAGYVPPHWKRSGGDRWDAGYQVTAYFLDWIEQRYGDGTVRELNGLLKNEYYEEMFEKVTGRPVKALWRLYCEELESDL